MAPRRVNTLAFIVKLPSEMVESNCERPIAARVDRA
jgi:hypothetical protein